jgi:hypothetical protein
MPRPKYLIALVALGLLAACGWSGDDNRDVPADFVFVLDASIAGIGPSQHVNIRINAAGEGRYERYETGGVIQGGENDMVVYQADQVVEIGKFKLQEDELSRLWGAINENNFFELTGDYRMAIGHAYAFILVEANDRRHQVFNIGMQVDEIKAILEATKSILPEAVEIEYGSGIVP